MSKIITGPAPATPRPPRAPATRRRAFAAAGSAAVALIGGWFMSDPVHNVLTDPDQALIRTVLGTTAATWVLLGLGLLGLVAALRSSHPVLAVVSVVEVVGLGVAFQSVSAIALAGYLVAMALPFALIGLAVQTFRRYPRARWLVLAALLVVVAWGVVTRRSSRGTSPA